MVERTHNAYHVGIICPLKIELAAMRAMLDEEHGRLDAQDPNDHNVYFAGCIHRHNVVIACLPAGIDGIAAAATVTKCMVRTFPQLRFVLLVGIGGGIPNPDRGIDIRLGDVVVSQPHGAYGGVIQYDKGKSKSGSVWERKGSLNAPPTFLLTALQSLQAEHELNGIKLSTYLNEMATSRPKMIELGYGHPGVEKDVWGCSGSLVQTNKKKRKRLTRDERPNTDPFIHYGTIASGNTVVKDASLRDFIRDECGALCVEMEAAGLMNECPCLVIRGISDYADENKNDDWQRYAAAVAAAYAKELLLHVSMIHVAAEQAMQRILEAISSQSKNTTDFIRKQEERKLHQKCCQSLYTSTYVDYKDFHRKAVPGTCQWLLQHPKFLEWSQSSGNTLLWISADPGCGKSVLSRHLIDVILSAETKSLATQHTPHTVCYFFFKDNANQDSLSTALSAILHQIFLQQPNLIRYAVPAYKAGGDQLSRDAGQLWTILLNASKDIKAKPITCVFDGLDECSVGDRKRLIDYLCRFYDTRARVSSKLHGLFKILVTSRPYDDIQSAFEHIPLDLPSIRIRGEDENDQIHKEINLVIEQYMTDLSIELHLSPHNASRIKRKLFEMENRTYLWLCLVIDHIKSTFRRSLRPEKEQVIVLPRSVDEAYEQLLNRVEESAGDQIKVILSIILGARRALSVREMALALDIATLPHAVSSVRHFSIDPDRLRENIRQWCGLFIYINHGYIYLLHQTAKEFLLRKSAPDVVYKLRWKQCIQQLDVEKMMAIICIVYLNVREFDDDALNPWMQSADMMRSTRTREREYRSRYERSATLKGLGISEDLIEGAVSFFQYAARHWASHFRFSENTMTTTIRELSLKLYECNCLRFRRINYFTSSEHNFRGSSYELHAILLAAFNGHGLAIDSMCGPSLVHINTTEMKSGRTALIVAAEQGHTHVVQNLLSKGADPNIYIGHGDTALSIAAQKGYLGVVQTLLTGQPKTQFNLGRSFMQALKHEHRSIVILLLDSGMNTDMELDPWGLPLNPEESPKDRNLVTKLQQTGASMNGYHGWGSSLHMAVWKGDKTLVNDLISRGADINARCGRTGSVLRTACLVNNEEIIRLLWEKRAGIDPATDCFIDVDAVRTAIMYCSSEIVRHFIERKLNSTGGSLDNQGFLQAASARGNSAIVKFLIDRGADVNYQSSIFGTALCAAAERGHVRTVSMLLSHGADATAICREQGTAIHVAAAKGHLQVVRHLLEAGIDVDIQGGLYCSALQAASFCGHLDVVRLLLTEFADVNIAGGENYTALHAAAKNGHSDIVMLLLDAGADTTLRCPSLGLAFEAALQNGYGNLIEQVLQSGFDFESVLGNCNIDLLCEWYDELLRIVPEDYDKEWLNDVILSDSRGYQVDVVRFDSDDEDDDEYNPNLMFSYDAYSYYRDWGENSPDPSYYSYSYDYYDYDYVITCEAEIYYNGLTAAAEAAKEGFYQNMIAEEEAYLQHLVEAEAEHEEWRRSKKRKKRKSKK